MKASGISGNRMAFDFLLDALPRLLELGFFDFVWAEDFPVVSVVDDSSADDHAGHATCAAGTCAHDHAGADLLAVLDQVFYLDLDGASVRTYADEAGITPGNAGVRLHRAREALRRQLARSCGTCLTHGCLDCGCGNQTDGESR